MFIINNDSLLFVYKLGISFKCDVNNVRKSHYFDNSLVLTLESFNETQCDCVFKELDGLRFLVNASEEELLVYQICNEGLNVDFWGEGSHLSNFAEAQGQVDCAKVLDDSVLHFIRRQVGELQVMIIYEVVQELLNGLLHLQALLRPGAVDELFVRLKVKRILLDVFHLELPVTKFEVVSQDFLGF